MMWPILQAHSFFPVKRSHFCHHTPQSKLRFLLHVQLRCTKEMKEDFWMNATSVPLGIDAIIQNVAKKGVGYKFSN